jgi:hypothetical protein
VLELECDPTAIIEPSTSLEGTKRWPHANDVMFFRISVLSFSRFFFLSLSQKKGE